MLVSGTRSWLGATCSGRAAIASTALRHRHRTLHRWLQPCRVTNTSEEIYKAMGEVEDDGDTPQMLEVNQMQVLNPELGKLESRIGKFYLEELFNDSGVDLEETAYWFHTPPEGWAQKPLLMESAQEAPATFPQPEHLTAAEQGRVLLDELEEGIVVEGQITDCWLYHGIQVDIGAQFDGLVYLEQDEWMLEGVRETLMPGDVVIVRVFKKRRPGLYRWPLQLELLEPSSVAYQLGPASQYDAPIDHAWATDQGWSPERIAEEAGRPFQAAQYSIGVADDEWAEAMQQAYAYDDEESTSQPQPVEFQMVDLIQQAITAQNVVSSMRQGSQACSRGPVDT